MQPFAVRIKTKFLKSNYRIENFSPPHTQKKNKEKNVRGTGSSKRKDKNQHSIRLNLWEVWVFGLWDWFLLMVFKSPFVKVE